MSSGRFGIRCSESTTPPRQPGDDGSMRVLFTASPGAGHLFPVLPVAIAAAAAGHSVRVGCGASFAAVVRRAGLEHVALGPESLDVVRPRIAGLAAADGPGRAVLMYTEAFGHQIAAALADDISRFIEDWRPAVIVHEDMEMGSWIAAERWGIPHATIQAAAWRPWQRPLLVEHQNEIRRAHGLAADPDLTGRDGRPWFTTRPSALRDPAQPMPESFSELRPDPDDRVGGEVAALPDWLASTSGRPRVAVTLGTMNAHRIDLLRPIVDGLATLDADVVVALGADPATLGEVAPNVRVERYVAMSLLLPRSTVVVHHAGSGTTLAALAAGVPSVLIPITADQPVNAAAVVGAGAGIELGVSQISAEAATRAVSRLLETPEFTSRAGAIAAEIAGMPDAAAAWKDIEAVV
jgi:UDP:flavonoid glycosyltransferase YjiC (YdhE family)